MLIRSESQRLYKSLLQIQRNCHSKTKASDSQNISRGNWKSFVGLEIHAQLSTNSKLFSKAPCVYGAETNSAVALFDAAVPGTLPVLNKAAVKLAAISALALNCRINPVSYFDRKHYFYSDLPAGYQITQQHVPLAEKGKIEYAVFQPGVHKEPYYKSCGIKQIQLEQDSGKSLHETTDNQSYIDLNRAGIGLIEIVFEPEVEDGFEACALVKDVIKILRKAGCCSCKMEEGALRVDANVSVSKSEGELGVRTEIKNLNSIHAVFGAIEHEIKRQIDILKNGGYIENKTLAWNPDTCKTVFMRDKEEVQDYRFMPEPNLPPLRVIVDKYSENVHKNVKTKSFVLNLRDLKSEVPDSPQQERMLLKEKFGLSDTFAFNLVNQDRLYTFFKEIMDDSVSRDPNATYLFLMYQLINALNSKNLDLNDCKISSVHLGQIIDLMQTRRISRNTSDILLEELLNVNNTLNPLEIVAAKNLGIISNPKELRKICLRIVEREEATVIAYQKKKKKTLFNLLVNKVIEESKFRADTKVLPKIMSEVLDEIDCEK